MFEIDKELNKQLVFIKRCAKCNHSILKSGSPLCTTENFSCLEMFTAQPLVPIEKKRYDRYQEKEIVIQVEEKHCSYFTEPERFSLK